MATLTASALLLSGCVGMESGDDVAALTPQIMSDISTLASDEFKGRGPATPSETLVTDFIIDRFADEGLKPGHDGEWRQWVDLERAESAGTFLWVHTAGGKKVSGDWKLAATSAVPKQVSGTMPMVLIAPEAWQDRELPDLGGKMVLIAASENRDRALSANLREANAGAVFQILDNPDLFDRYAGYIKSERLRAPAEDDGSISGIITEQSVVAMTVASGKDWDALSAAATAPDAKPIALGLTGKVEIDMNIEPAKSANVMAVKPGRDAVDPDGKRETVMFLGHWDHLGECRDEEAKDRICNGAVDNASGIAALFAVAHTLENRAFDRDLLFVATTSEESGLLGAKGLAASNALDNRKIVAAFNMDTLAIGGSGGPVAIIGGEGEEIDTIVTRLIEQQGLAVAPRSAGEPYDNRQDGAALNAAGIPTRMVNSAFGNVDAIDAFLKRPYHQPGDEYSPMIQIGNVLQDIRLHLSYADYFANRASFEGS